MTHLGTDNTMRRGNRKKHKHTFTFVNPYRKYDLYRCGCGKEKKVMIVTLPKGFGEMKYRPLS